MATIRNIIPATKRPDLSWERREFISPDSSWNLIYHSPFEWRMGRTGWKVMLFHHGRDVTAEHEKALTVASGKGFRCAPGFQPWSHDSKRLVLVTFEETPTYLYEVTTKRVSEVHSDKSFLHTAQWSPDIDRLLVMYRTGGMLFDHKGEQHGIAAWNIGEFESPHVYWMKRNGLFFSISREHTHTKTRLTVFRGEDASFVEAFDLDPADLVPYDAAAYAKMPRNKWCLISSSGTRSIGVLLDIWHHVEFDQTSNRLFFSVRRPISEPYEDQNDMFCDVEERWITAELSM